MRARLTVPALAALGLAGCGGQAISVPADGGPERDALLGLAAQLRGSGVPLDGIGLQDHTTLDGALSQAELEDTMNRVAGLGLDVAVVRTALGSG